MSEGGGSGWGALIVGGILAAGVVLLTTLTPSQKGGRRRDDPADEIAEKSDEALAGDEQREQELERILDEGKKQLEAKRTMVEEIRTLRADRDRTQQQEDALPAKAVYQSISKLAGLVPVVGKVTGGQVLGAAEVASEAKQAKECWDEAEATSDPAEQRRLIAEGNAHAESAAEAAAKTLASAVPGLSDVVDVAEGALYNPFMEKVALEATKLQTDGEILAKELAYAQEKLAELERELGAKDARYLAEKQAAEQFAQDTRANLDAREKQLAKWSRAVQSATLMPDQDLPDEGLSLEEHGTAHESAETLLGKAQAQRIKRETLLHEHYRSRTLALEASSEASSDDPPVRGRRAPKDMAQNRDVESFRKTELDTPADLQKAKMEAVREERKADRARRRDESRERRQRRTAKREAQQAENARRAQEARERRAAAEESSSSSSDSGSDRERQERIELLEEIMSEREQTLQEMRDNDATTDADVKKEEGFYEEYEAELRDLKG